jgi:hypothetical protein
MRRVMFLAAGLLLAGAAQAQETAQRELNALTGAPAGTRCFQSIELAQELTAHYVATGICPQDLSAMDPAEFMSALAQLNAIDSDFASDACQVQMKLMFRAGREWVGKDPRGRCAEAADGMRDRPYFRNYVRGR